MPNGEPHDEVDWRDLRPLLHEEVARLPERYRLPFVLCHLEGKTNEEAADLLGLPTGTILSRLFRARERLRGRLTRRGLAPTSALSATLLVRDAAGAAVPATLAEGTLSAALAFTGKAGALGGVAASVRTLADGSLRAAALTAGLKLTAGIALTALAAMAAGVFVFQAQTPGREGGAQAGLRTPDNRLSATRREDKDPIHGTWIVAAAEYRGQTIDGIKSRVLVLKGDRFGLRAGQQEVRGILPTRPLEGRAVLAPGSPNRVDLLDEGGWHLRGIYELQGDNLRMCLSESNSQERPTDFTTNPAGNQLLLELKRD
jgi:uncharacterized protein (TIGR03067 family)